jgi:hypothetical protein
MIFRILRSTLSVLFALILPAKSADAHTDIFVIPIGFDWVLFMTIIAALKWRYAWPKPWRFLAWAFLINAPKWLMLRADVVPGWGPIAFAFAWLLPTAVLAALWVRRIRGAR